MRLLIFLSIFLLHEVSGRDDDDDEPYDPYTTTDPKKREPSPCEVCKFFITELQDRLALSAKSKSVLELGHRIDQERRKIPYKTSELRLTEALHEPHICEKILEYNVHAERKGSLRYAKGRSETFSTLHGLVDKGVKVELGIPYDLWDKPSAEVTKMQRICFKMAESYEEDIEDWYYNYQDTHNLMEYLCRERYLKDQKWDDKCLDEVFDPNAPKEEEPESEEEEKSEADEAKAKQDKQTMDRLIQEQAEEQRLGHKLYKGEVGESEEERLEKEKKKKDKKKKTKGKKNKKGDPGHDFSKDRDEL